MDLTVLNTLELFSKTFLNSHTVREGRVLIEVHLDRRRDVCH